MMRNPFLCLKQAIISTAVIPLLQGDVRIESIDTPNTDYVNHINNRTQHRRNPAAQKVAYACLLYMWL